MLEGVVVPLQVTVGHVPLEVSRLCHYYIVYTCYFVYPLTDKSHCRTGVALSLKYSPRVPLTHMYPLIRFGLREPGRGSLM